MKQRSPIIYSLLVGFFIWSMFATSNVAAEEPAVTSFTPDSAPVTEYMRQGMIMDSVIIEFDSTDAVRTAQAAELYSGVEFDNSLTYRPVARYTITDGSDPLSVISRLESMPGIRNVYPNYRRSCNIEPNDPYYSLQQPDWQLVQAPAGWDLETGSAEVLVGVIDTGLDPEHPDLLPNLVLPGVNVREDWVPEEITDDSGHGTGVTGLIGAVGNNGVGIAGGSWNVRILPIRACGGPTADCDLFDEVEGIDIARERGCDIINMSLGGIGTITLEQEAVAAAYAAGIVIVAAAGNDGQHYVATGDAATDKSNLYYPAALPGVIGVGAINRNGERADFSNYGEAIVNVMAPGVEVITTVPDYECYMYSGDGPPYSYGTGTSYSTPMVSGLAALILSKYPGLSPDDVRMRIEKTAVPMAGPDDNGNGINDYFGYGIVNFAGALSQSGSASSQYMRVGVTENPVMPGEVLVIVQSYVQLTSVPSGIWTVGTSTIGGSITFSEMPNRPNYYIGRFGTNETGNLSITVNAFVDGAPVAPVTALYVLSD